MAFAPRYVEEHHKKEVHFPGHLRVVSLPVPTDTQTAQAVPMEEARQGGALAPEGKEDIQADRATHTEAGE